MNRVGVVLDSDQDSVRVATTPGGGCGACSENGACGLLLYQTGSEGQEVLVADNAIGARPGDSVELELPPGVELGLSALVWGVPVLGLVVGAAVGALGHAALGLSQDAGVLLGAGLGTGLAYALLRVIDRRAARSRRIRPRVVRLVAPGVCPSAGQAHEGRRP